MALPAFLLLCDPMHYAAESHRLRANDARRINIPRPCLQERAASIQERVPERVRGGSSSHHDGWAVCLTRLAGSNGYLPAWTRPALPVGWLGWLSPGQVGLAAWLGWLGWPGNICCQSIHKQNHKQSH